MGGRGVYRLEGRAVLLPDFFLSNFSAAFGGPGPWGLMTGGGGVWDTGSEGPLPRSCTGLRALCLRPAGGCIGAA